MPSYSIDYVLARLWMIGEGTSLCYWAKVNESAVTTLQHTKFFSAPRSNANMEGHSSNLTSQTDAHSLSRKEFRKHRKRARRRQWRQARAIALNDLPTTEHPNSDEGS
jgi:hypothetical protein